MNFSVKVETSEDLSFRKTLHIELTRTFPSSSKPNYAELYLEIKSLTSVVIAKEFNDLQVIATFQGKKEWQKRDSLYYIELNKTEKSVVDLSIENTNDRAREHYESVKGAIELRKQSSIVNRAELEEPIIPEIIQSTVQQNQYQESRPINYEPQLRCPKCSSTQLMPTKKGYSLGKAVVGGLLTGGVGLLGGFWGSNDIRLNCLNCGHKWQPK
jgi:cytochrome c-type biogenesis protein CcmH/NrfF